MKLTHTDTYSLLSILSSNSTDPT